MRDWRRRNPVLAASLDTASTANQRAKRVGATGWITAADVREVWTRQPACVECGNGRGLDHIVAFRDGGMNVPDNLQNLCRACNGAKEYAAQKGRPKATHCGKGHEMVGHNVMPTPKGRDCRTCFNERARRYGQAGRDRRRHAGIA